MRLPLDAATVQGDMEEAIVGFLWFACKCRHILKQWSKVPHQPGSRTGHYCSCSGICQSISGPTSSQNCLDKLRLEVLLSESGRAMREHLGDSHPQAPLGSLVIAAYWLSTPDQALQCAGSLGLAYAARGDKKQAHFTKKKCETMKNCMCWPPPGQFDAVWWLLRHVGKCKQAAEVHKQLVDQLRRVSSKQLAGVQLGGIWLTVLYLLIYLLHLWEPI